MIVETGDNMELTPMSRVIDDIFTLKPDVKHKEATLNETNRRVADA